MQDAIRRVFQVVLLILYFIYLEKKRPCRKKAFSYFTVCIVVMILICIPVENFFLRFRSYEAAFHYLSQKGDIVSATETKHSVLLISSDGTEKEFLYLKKQGGRYQAPLQQPESTLQGTYDGTVFVYIQEPNTDNYYFIITTYRESHVVIQDSENTVFSEFSISEEAADYWTEYVAYVEDVDETYYIQLGDEIITFPFNP